MKTLLTDERGVFFPEEIVTDQKECARKTAWYHNRQDFLRRHLHAFLRQAAVDALDYAETFADYQMDEIQLPWLLETSKKIEKHSAKLRADLLPKKPSGRRKSNTKSDLILKLCQRYAKSGKIPTKDEFAKRAELKTQKGTGDKAALDKLLKRRGANWAQIKRYISWLIERGTYPRGT
jgi:hypothetical protein